MKKVLLLLLVLGLGIFFVGCGPQKDDAKDLETKKTELIGKKDNLVKSALLKYEEIEEGKTAADVPLGEFRVVKGKKTEATKLVSDIDATLAKKVEGSVTAGDLIKEIDALIAKVDAMLADVNKFIIKGEQKKVYEKTIPGLEEAWGDLNKLIDETAVGTKAEDVLQGTQFITAAIQQEAKDVLAEVKTKLDNHKSATTTPGHKEITTAEIPGLLDQLKAAYKKVVDNILTGTKVQTNADTYALDLDKLNLGGKTIKFYTHQTDKDNPFDSSYSEENVNQAEYQQLVNELQSKYNFKFEFVAFENEENKKHPEQVKTAVDQSGNTSYIVRLNEKNKLAQCIINGSVTTIAPVLDAFAKLQNHDEYVISPWQVENGKIFGVPYGIQRGDGVTYPDLMMFNRKYLKQHGLTDDEMPDKLWENNQWTFEKLQELNNKVAAQLNNGNAKKTDSTYKYAFGLTPSFIGIQAVNANGVRLIDQSKTNREDQINVKSTEVSDIITAYMEEVQKTQNGWVNETKLADLAANKYIYKNTLFDWLAKSRVGITAIQNWQAGGLKDDDKLGKSGDFSVVPFPQMGAQNNAKYLQPVSSGDIIAVTKGENHNDVAAILMLVNQFMKKQYNKKMETSKQQFKNILPANPTNDEVLTAIFIHEKTVNTNPADETRAMKIAAFIHGYDTKTAPTNHTILIGDELTSISAVETYEQFVIQQALKENTDYKTLYDAKKNDFLNSYNALMTQVFGE